LSIDAIDAIEFSEDNQDLDKVVNKNADETAILGIGILNKT
jgi:hypothetical protein